jgi:hypothetical protein
MVTLTFRRTQVEGNQSTLAPRRDSSGPLHPGWTQSNDGHDPTTLANGAPPVPATRPPRFVSQWSTRSIARVHVAVGRGEDMTAVADPADDVAARGSVELCLTRAELESVWAAEAALDPSHTAAWARRPAANCSTPTPTSWGATPVIWPPLQIACTTWSLLWAKVLFVDLPPTCHRNHAAMTGRLAPSSRSATTPTSIQVHGIRRPFGVAVEAADSGHIARPSLIVRLRWKCQ